MFSFSRRKKQKGAEYPDQVGIDFSSPVWQDLSWSYYDNIVKPSASVYGNELYEFIDSCSGTSHYKDGSGRLLEFYGGAVFVYCSYCGSKNNINSLKCEFCGGNP